MADGIIEISEQELGAVSGGSFWSPNKFKQEVYNQAGVRTDYGFFAKDKFWAKNSRGEQISISYGQANAAVRLWRSKGEQPTYEEIAQICRR
jgi:hypothetical protein